MACVLLKRMSLKEMRTLGLGLWARDGFGVRRTKARARARNRVGVGLVLEGTWSIIHQN